ncbi:MULTISPECIES: alpha/beta hydrolase [Hwangdonia]|uniref:Alpha/beta hydrolase fold domain-containing protein n=1 Tax=Hwangdonia seohaensis TaxID=1240727 RepID=A0ABW3RA60_9FLAO|nr:alpha/beta hydrolase [Hwangdonia seohaensis]
MNALKSTFLILIITLVAFSCSNETATEDPITSLDPSKYYEELNISYGEDADQKFDLYLPANRTANTKLMVLVHGGGWSAGDKAEMNPIKDLLRQDFPNLAIVNINYRLADENNNPYPMQMEDITTIINHLKDNKINYTISEAIGFIGTSAGGHLSLLWSYAFDANTNVNMVCSIVGPTNLTDPAYLNNTNPVLQELLDLYGANATTDFLEEVSPFHQATVLSPPTILFYGGQDPLIPTTQGTDMRDKLQSLGVTHEFTLYPNAGHGWIGLELLDTWVKLKVFINNHL